MTYDSIEKIWKFHWLDTIPCNRLDDIDLNKITTILPCILK